MHPIHNRRVIQLNGYPWNRVARKKPIMANGIAKIVWLNTTKER
jgi:hypothetical protein